MLLFAIDIEPMAQATAPLVYYKKALGAPLALNEPPPGERTEVIFNAYETEGRFTIMNFKSPVGPDSSPGHFHTLHSETYMLISGTLESP